MKHPNQWTIFKLWFYEYFKKNASFFKKKNLATLVEALNFLFSFKQILDTCLLNLRLLSVVTPRSSTSFRSSRQEVLCYKGVLRNLPEAWNFIKKETLAGLKPETLLKKRLWHRCFPVNFVKFLRTPFLTKHLRSLFLYLSMKVVKHLISSWFHQMSKHIYLFISLFTRNGKLADFHRRF